MAAPDEKRLHPRLTKRVRIRYRSVGDSSWRSAFSQDVSTFGLYVHANSIPSVAGIEVEVIDADVNEQILLRGRVLRGKKVPPRLRRMIKSGFAVELRDVPHDWHRYCLDLEEKARERGRFLHLSTEVTEVA